MPDTPAAGRPTPITPPPRARRRTSARARMIEHIARIGITAGGLGVIVAVLGILVFLAASVLPLFERGRASLAAQGSVLPREHIVAAITDEYKGLLTLVTPDGVRQVVTLVPQATDVNPSQQSSATAAPGSSMLPTGETPTAWSFDHPSGTLAIGYESGKVQIARLGYTSGLEGLPEYTASGGAELAIGARRPIKDGYVERVSLDQVRTVTATLFLQPPAVLAVGVGPVRAIGYAASGSDQYLVAVRESGSAAFSIVNTIRPLGGGEDRITLTPVEFAIKPATPNTTTPAYLFVTSDGADIFTLSIDGTLDRYAVSRNGEADSIAFTETLSTLAAGEHITAAAMLLGGKTLLIGTDRARVLAGFVVPDASSTTPDQRRFVIAHTFDLAPSGASAITTLGIGQRDRTIVAGDARGSIFVRNITSAKAIVDLPSRRVESAPDPLTAADICPKNDGLITLSRSGAYRLFDYDPKYSEASAHSLFGSVWYEGEQRPSYTYQSSSGENTAEPKLSLIPLIWGTLKATIYAMLFAVPLALLAAIYTSEMLHPDIRNRVKPVVESMASLPSVVLGFIAALILAPFAREHLPSILLGFFVVPVGVLTGAYLWQTTPTRIRARLSSGGQFAVVTLVALTSVAASASLGPVVERALFTPSDSDVLALAGSCEPVAISDRPAWLGRTTGVTPAQARALRPLGLYARAGEIVRPVGSLTDPAIAKRIRADHLDRADIRLWLDSTIGGPFPGWLLLLMPPGAALAVLLKSRLIDPVSADAGRLPGGPGLVELVKFVFVCALSVALAALAALVLTAAGLDARASILGPFNQRNSLIVGIIMGFAIIPIIFTVSEDALSSVSPGLRSASIGAGATRWQTAVRVVLPVAASGIFSACMIGLGRATGETMIVLMATGNTPIMDTSMFSGFRSLAANIAVELPEAPSGSTHYRVLFLCGLVLFGMTFIVNTAAEVVRQRFRRRIAGL